MTLTNDTAPSSDHLGVATSIDALELRQLLGEDPETLILDVRTGAEFESVHIPGSFNVPLDTLSEHAREMADVAHNVILVCASGTRATSARGKLEEAGKSNLRVLDGGMGAWQSAGGDVVRGDAKWELERQVRGVAGALVFASILASIPFPKTRFLAGGIGFGLLFAAVSNTCAMGMLLAKLPYNRGPKCDLDCVLADMHRL
jgi:rhodanese-related sulfurtransferase